MGVGASQKHVESRSILGTLKEETVILIRARISSGAARFSINLACLNEDVAFHFNPRFDESPQVVVCNTYRNGCWEKEERTSNMPFRRAESFGVTITVRSECYEVSVNGKHFLRYDHRLPYHTVKKLMFKGDISVENVSYSSAKEPPPYSPASQKDSPIEIGDSMQNKQYPGPSDPSSPGGLTGKGLESVTFPGFHCGLRRPPEMSRKGAQSKEWASLF